MNKIGLTLTLIVVFALSASIAGADFYKYIDENGTVRYTDDASQIPDSQKDHAPRYQEANPLPLPAEEAGPPPSDSGDNSRNVAGIEPAEKDAAPVEDKEPPADLGQWRQELEKQRMSLEESYLALTTELEAFRAEKNKANTKSRVKAYNQRAAELNHRIEVYEKRREDLNRQVEAYNSASQRPAKKTE